MIPRLVEDPGLDEVVQRVVSDLGERVWGSISPQMLLTAPGVQKATGAHRACPCLPLGRREGGRVQWLLRLLSQGLGAAARWLQDAEQVTHTEDSHLEVVADAQLQAVGAHGEVSLGQVDLGHEEVGVHGGGVQLQAMLQDALGILQLS